MADCIGTFMLGSSDDRKYSLRDVHQANPGIGVAHGYGKAQATLSVGDVHMTLQVSRNASKA